MPPLVFLNRYSRIKIGNNVKLASCSLQNQICKDRLIMSTQASGDEIIIGDGSEVSCSILYEVNSIRIGKNVNIEANCRIFDTDFHPVDIDARRFHNKLEINNSPVIIEDDVRLAGNVTILKGVRIGRGTIIGFGSAVACDIPAGVLAVGTPAKVIKNIVK
jgi:acetyltransferase-like isoleucine patch superfamily enzyme